jgi:hypothetical protein
VMSSTISPIICTLLTDGVPEIMLYTVKTSTRSLQIGHMKYSLSSEKGAF